MTHDEKILNRVRALLTKAEDPAATPAEADLFEAKAEELIAKYAVDLAMLESQSTHKGKPTLRKIPIPNPYGKPKGSLLLGICKAYSCRVVRVRDEGTFHVMGFPSDIDLVDMLYTSLLLQGTNALLHQPRRDRSFRTSYWWAFAGQVNQRLQETRRKATAETSTALVLRDRESDVEEFYREQFPSVRKSSPARVSSRAGANAGVSAANRADMGGPRFSGSRTAIG